MRYIKAATQAIILCSCLLVFGQNSEAQCEKAKKKLETAERRVKSTANYITNIYNKHDINLAKKSKNCGEKKTDAKKEACLATLRMREPGMERYRDEKIERQSKKLGRLADRRDKAQSAYNICLGGDGGSIYE